MCCSLLMFAGIMVLGFSVGAVFAYVSHNIGRWSVKIQDKIVPTFDVNLGMLDDEDGLE